MFTYKTEHTVHGKNDIAFLKRVFDKLVLNFTWWVNRKDRDGRNIFEGGFLGLDNIGVFDRSAPLPTGGYLEQADGTAWMAPLCTDNVSDRWSFPPRTRSMRIWPLSSSNISYGSRPQWTTLVTTTMNCGMRKTASFTMSFACRTAAATAFMYGRLWVCCRSASTVLMPEELNRLKETQGPTGLDHPRAVGASGDHRSPEKTGVNGRHLLAILDETKLRRVLARMLDESEFLSPHGIRSLSRYHKDHPFTVPGRRR